MYNDVSLCKTYRAGNQMGLLTLVNWLAQEYEVTILHTHYKPISVVMPANIKVIWRPDFFNLLHRKVRALLRVEHDLLNHKKSFWKRFFWSQCLNDEKYDAIIIQYIDNSFLLDEVPSYLRSKCVADLHDLFSARSKSFSNFGVIPNENLQITEMAELAQIDRFAKVLFVQPYEAKRVNALLCRDVAIATRRGPDVQNKHVPDARGTTTSQTQIGFIGNRSEFNVDAIKFTLSLLDQSPDFTLKVAGSVCEKLRDNRHYLHKLGEVEDLDQFYASLDCTVNHVQYGSGIKTKNIESLFYGVPVITSTVGAEGLEDLIGKGIFVANTADELEGALRTLRHMDNRNAFHEEIRSLALKTFSPQVIFKPLQTYLQSIIDDQEADIDHA